MSDAVNPSKIVCACLSVRNTVAGFAAAYKHLMVLIRNGSVLVLRDIVVVLEVTATEVHCCRYLACCWHLVGVFPIFRRDTV